MGQPNTAPPQLIGTSEAPPYVPPPGSPPLMAGATPVAPPPAPIDYKSLGSGQAQADFAAASAGGGWEFDVEGMDALILDLQDRIDVDLGTMQAHTVHLTVIQPPGDEVASMQYAEAANRAGREFLTSHESSVQFLTAYVETLRRIRTAYQEQDQAAIDALRGNGKAD
jgi:hypothetical protein